MDFIIADANKKDLCFLDEGASLDFDVGVSDDFQISIALDSYDPEAHIEGNILYCIGTEYGGIFNDPEISIFKYAFQGVKRKHGCFRFGLSI